jgi:hypothetical protein
MAPAGWIDGMGWKVAWPPATTGSPQGLMVPGGQQSADRVGHGPVGQTPERLTSSAQAAELRARRSAPRRDGVSALLRPRQGPGAGFPCAVTSGRPAVACSWLRIRDRTGERHERRVGEQRLPGPPPVGLVPELSQMHDPVQRPDVPDEGADELVAMPAGRKRLTARPDPQTHRSMQA